MFLGSFDSILLQGNFHDAVLVLYIEQGKMFGLYLKEYFLNILSR